MDAKLPTLLTGMGPIKGRVAEAAALPGEAAEGIAGRSVEASSIRAQREGIFSGLPPLAGLALPGKFQVCPKSFETIMLVLRE